MTWSYRRREGKDWYYPVGAKTDAVRILRHIVEGEDTYTYTLRCWGRRDEDFRALKDATQAGNKVLGLVGESRS